MKHKSSHHIFLALILFAIGTIFFPAATWGNIFATAAHTTGIMMSSGSGNYSGLAAAAEGLIPMVIAIIINIIIYYSLAAIILFIFGIFSKNKK
ncbi:hypothetical protein GOV10_01010 [Candidatus Woesearchaeota archaeon]|nr:hypothetical protein [Candidatus Woesearchaeota archaeon]